MNPYSFTRMRQFAPLALVLLCTLVAVAAYLQALDYPFVSDDTAYITDNHKLADLRLDKLWRIFIEPYNDFSEFLPLRDFSYWFDIALFGMNPAAFRAHNLLLYLLCLPLVYSTTSGLWRHFRPADAANAPWVAAITTTLFALHPSHAEAVVWISGRKDVLSGTFSLFALWLAVSAKRERGLSAPYAVTTLLMLLAAMLSKATAVAVAPVIALLWLLFWRDIAVSDRHRSMLLWPLASLLLAACVALVFSIIIQSKLPVYFGIEAVTRSLAVLGWLARLAASPETRHFFYPVFEDPHLPIMVACGATVLIVAAAGGVMILRRRSLKGFALIAFLLICIPSINLIPYRLPSLVSDRFIFLAVWPAILLLVALSWHLKPVPRAALLLAIALPWGFQATERIHDWRSIDAMVDTDLRAYPGFYAPAVYKIISVQLPQGLNQAANETANSITIPEFRDAMIELVKADYAVRTRAVANGNPQEAMDILWRLGRDLKKPPLQAKWNPPINTLWDKKEIALTIEWEYLAWEFPNDASVRYNVGLWMLNIRNYEDAVTHLRAAAESQHLPESMRGTAFYNLGFALLNSGHIVEAEMPLRAALWMHNPQAYCLLSRVYKQIGRLDDAARAEAGCPDRPTIGEAAQ